MLPVLYSFRRCPYAMRARLALAAAGIAVQLREVSLADKPAELIAVSPKATVPVLCAGDELIEESVELMHWALRQHDPLDWLAADLAHAELIDLNDTEFKPALDHYKYFSRHPERPRAAWRDDCIGYLQGLESRLQRHDGAGLLRHSPCIADAAIFPFVRQFAGADPTWFASAPYPRLQHWLKTWLDTPLFARVMHKYPRWVPGTPTITEFWTG